MFYDTAYNTTFIGITFNVNIINIALLYIYIRYKFIQLTYFIRSLTKEDLLLDYFNIAVLWTRTLRQSSSSVSSCS